jgi:hypothetical protein
LLDRWLDHYALSIATPMCKSDVNFELPEFKVHILALPVREGHSESCLGVTKSKKSLVKLWQIIGVNFKLARYLLPGLEGLTHSSNADFGWMSVGTIEEDVSF